MAWPRREVLGPERRRAPPSNASASLVSLTKSLNSAQSRSMLKSPQSTAGASAGTREKVTTSPAGPGRARRKLHTGTSASAGLAAPGERRCGPPGSTPRQRRLPRRTRRLPGSEPPAASRSAEPLMFRDAIRHVGHQRLPVWQERFAQATRRCPGQVAGSGRPGARLTRKGHRDRDSLG